MRYRELSPSGDYQFGRTAIFLSDSPAVVVQAILTRLHLWSGEWFLDDREGTPYEQGVLGHGTQGTRDLVLKSRILGTPGVSELISYSSSVDAARKMTVQATVQTIYGASTFTAQV